MKKNFWVFSMILLVPVMVMPLQACSLLPKEEKHYQVQVVHQDITADYRLAVAQIDDVIKTKDITCEYSQMKEEKLSFHKSNKTVSFVYVQEGDEVKKGEVLLRLNTEETENKLEDLKDRIEVNQLLIKQAKESEKFYQSKLDSENCSRIDKEQYQWELLNCDEDSRKYNDDIEQIKGEEKSLLKDLKSSALVAGMDGTVTYLSDDILKDKTEAGADVIRIADTKACAFLIKDKVAAKHLKIGQKVDVAISQDQSYKAVVSKINKKKSRINLSIENNDYTMEVGTRGSIKLYLTSKKQVLTIPKDALHRTKAFYYVYYLDKNGIRNYKKVSVGLIGDTQVEITKGLKENDSVIINNN